MRHDLTRLLRPGSVAVIGGGAWCRQVVRQLVAQGFDGPIWRVHPDAAAVEGVPAVPGVADLPGVPDAAFVGVNRHASIDVVAALAQMGAGGAVCFASGFSEAVREDAGAGDLQADLVAAAGAMPVLGPNCYGFINAFDGVLLWPDQHGCRPVDRGVAILTQSSNIAINLTMQRRAVPIGFVVACGNMAQTSQAQIAMALLDDPRITAIGLHIEGFGCVADWHALAIKAQARGVPLIALKVGASEAAQRTALSHTASLAGSDAGAGAVLRRLGIARLTDLPGFLETLKLLHCAGPLQTDTVSSISCSGGEASLVADMARGMRLAFPPLVDAQTDDLRQALGPMVALSNPLDYHTYIWGDAHKMAAAWTPMAAGHIGLTLIIIDYPHTDASGWAPATQAAIATRRASGRPVAVVATLPELMPEAVAAELLAAEVTPLCGLREALVAAEAAAHLGPPEPAPIWMAHAPVSPEMISEPAAKALLHSYGVAVPRGVTCMAAEGFGHAAGLAGPLALKSLGLAHKSDVGAVRLGLAAADLAAASKAMDAAVFLVEEMVPGSVAELLIGGMHDPAHGFVLTLGAGGVLTELWQDSVSLLLPVSEADVATALQQLRIYPLLTGFRGGPCADIAAVTAAVMGMQRCVVAQAGAIAEVEINPLICTEHGAVAADALIRMDRGPIPQGD